MKAINNIFLLLLMVGMSPILISCAVENSAKPQGSSGGSGISVITNLLSDNLINDLTTSLKSASSRDLTRGRNSTKSTTRSTHTLTDAQIDAIGQHIKDSLEELGLGDSDDLLALAGPVIDNFLAGIKTVAPTAEDIATLTQLGAAMMVKSANTYSDKLNADSVESGSTAQKTFFKNVVGPFVKNMDKAGVTTAQSLSIIGDVIGVIYENVDESGAEASEVAGLLETISAESVANLDEVEDIDADLIEDFVDKFTEEGMEALNNIVMDGITFADIDEFVGSIGGGTIGALGNLPDSITGGSGGLRTLRGKAMSKAVAELDRVQVNGFTADHIDDVMFVLSEEAMKGLEGCDGDDCEEDIKALTGEMFAAFDEIEFEGFDYEDISEVSQMAIAGFMNGMTVIAPSDDYIGDFTSGIMEAGVGALDDIEMDGFDFTKICAAINDMSYQATTALDEFNEVFEFEADELTDLMASVSDGATIGSNNLDDEKIDGTLDLLDIVADIAAGMTDAREHFEFIAFDSNDFTNMITDSINDTNDLIGSTVLAGVEITLTSDEVIVEETATVAAAAAAAELAAAEAAAAELAAAEAAAAAAASTPVDVSTAISDPAAMPDTQIYTQFSINWFLPDSSETHKYIIAYQAGALVPEDCTDNSYTYISSDYIEANATLNPASGPIPEYYSLDYDSFSEGTAYSFLICTTLDETTYSDGVSFQGTTNSDTSMNEPVFPVVDTVSSTELDILWTIATSPPTVASYLVAYYQTGAIADPETCPSTSDDDITVLNISQANYAIQGASYVDDGAASFYALPVSGLTPDTSYTFRVCSVGEDSSNVSDGVTSLGSTNAASSCSMGEELGDCTVGDACMFDEDCDTSNCAEGICDPPAFGGCTIGGGMADCNIGEMCASNFDCIDNNCVEGVCDPPAFGGCTMGGGLADCDIDEMCAFDADCIQNNCEGGFCAAPSSCNTGEGMADCDIGEMCASNFDCILGNCDDFFCAAPSSCTNGGGQADCDIGEACTTSADCIQNNCDGGTCALPQVTDPINFTATVTGATTVSLDWDAPGDFTAETYSVEWAIDPATPDVGCTGAGAPQQGISNTYYGVTSLDADTTYNFRVCSSATNFSDSDGVTALGAQTSLGEIPYSLSYSSIKGIRKFTLDWDAATPNVPDSYTLALAEGDTAPATCELGTVTSGIMDTTIEIDDTDGLTLYDTTYSIRICANYSGVNSVGTAFNDLIATSVEPLEFDVIIQGGDIYTANATTMYIGWIETSPRPNNYIIAYNVGPTAPTDCSAEGAHDGIVYPGAGGGEELYTYKMISDLTEAETYSGIICISDPVDGTLQHASSSGVTFMYDLN